MKDKNVSRKGKAVVIDNSQQLAEVRLRKRKRVERERERNNNIQSQRSHRGLISRVEELERIVQELLNK